MPIKRRVSDIIEEVAKAPTEEQKINLLRQNGDRVIQMYLKMATDQNLQWAVPSGAPPYTPNRYPDCEYVLYNELRRMYLFHKGGHPTLKPARCQQLFTSLLESLDPKDADFLVNVVKDRKLPEGLTLETIKRAFPGL